MWDKQSEEKNDYLDVCLHVAMEKIRKELEAKGDF